MPLSSGAAARNPAPPPDPAPRDPAHAPRDEPLLLTIDETAALLRTTRKAVNALIERAQLAGVVRLGRRVLVRRDPRLSPLSEKRPASPGRFRR